MNDKHSTSVEHSAPVVPGSKVRSALLWFGSRGSSSTPLILEPLIAALKANHPKADTELIERAYDVAERMHRGQLRKSGDPYITHPVAVATILAELGLTPSTLAAALLHDTVEDTDYSLEQLTEEFGEEIALLVDGVTKLDKVTYGEAAQAETVRKMVIAMARDIRVLVIKLADRLHNARTWRYVSASSAGSKARETLEIYAPLAHRLGMNTLKWELEDLSFAALYPKVYEEIVQLVSERAPARDEYLGVVREQILTDMKAARIKVEVTGRPKHYYSIYQKMIVGGREFDDIYDLLGVRVLVESVRDCYAVLGEVHNRWNPIPGRFKDYIAMPKFNMYQSLHTTVIGPEGKPVEIQIRSHEMHRRAEYGVAAHWKYKEQSRGGKVSEQSGGDMPWLQQLVDWQRETVDPTEFLDSLRYEMSGAQVYVFTPKGDVIALPAEATPIDFAYAVHTEVGHRTVGARVNGRLVPLDSELETGDTVEVFTSKSQSAGPSRDWLNIVRSPRARNKIKQWFTKERREEAIEAGKDLLARAVRKKNLPLQRLLSADNMLALVHELSYKDVSALYAAIGEGHISASNALDRLLRMVGGEEGAEEDLAEATRPTRARPATGVTSSSAIIVEGLEDAEALTKLARCCTPVPGDEISGFVTRGHGVSVHRIDCVNFKNMSASDDGRVIGVKWAGGHDAAVFLVQVQVEALDRNGLLSDVTKVLSDNHVNILSANVGTTTDRVAVLRFLFEMAEPSHLGHVLGQVRGIESVFDAFRVTGSKADDEPAENPAVHARYNVE